ncbi:MAG: hypothetical protein V2I32_08620 [Desulforhopalus sp.]|jgi:hypothetical protein|nr:hypothetical protein [Desulforhopalus sp.]
MEKLASSKTIDLFSDCCADRPELRTDLLFGPACGKMFGILVALTPTGEKTQLYAFSGSYNGVWVLPGWAPPLFDLAVFTTLTHPVEVQIKALGEQISSSPEQSAQLLNLRRDRRRLSRELMGKIHRLYRLHNFRGESFALQEAFLGDGNMPSGTGDCCAPKLIDLAARRGLRPISMAEFYWGREGSAGKRRHGVFYSACSSKCAPILGRMLCGCNG